MRHVRQRTSGLPRNFAAILFVVLFVIVTVVVLSSSLGHSALSSSVEYPGNTTTPADAMLVPPPPTLDIGLYDAKMNALAHIGTTSASSTRASTTSKRLWPVKAPYPNYGAILPFSRIVAFYGNFYSRGMGILGENDATTTRVKLLAEAKKWSDADPSTPVIPAVDYIAITAQEAPGFDKRYRARMPHAEIQKAVDLARSVGGITIIDIQVGLSDVQTEVPLLKKFLMMPDVHLAIDPEFSMKTGKRPGKVIGTEDAADINFAAKYLSNLVKDNNLPPKLLIIHRFTGDMLTNASKVRPLPEVQIVVDMDGWGSPEKKIGTYNRIVAAEPIQFTGFKLFYKNDLFPPSKRLMETSEILSLTPMPSFIQYQ